MYHIARLDRIDEIVDRIEDVVILITSVCHASAVCIVLLDEVIRLIPYLCQYTECWYATTRCYSCIERSECRPRLADDGVATATEDSRRIGATFITGEGEMLDIVEQLLWSSRIDETVDDESSDQKSEEDEDTSDHREEGRR